MLLDCDIAILPDLYRGRRFFLGGCAPKPPLLFTNHVGLRYCSISRRNSAERHLCHTPAG
jgi:hypothetical protein